VHHPREMLQPDAAIDRHHDYRNCFTGAFANKRATEDPTVGQGKQLQEALGVVFADGTVDTGEGEGPGLQLVSVFSACLLLCQPNPGHFRRRKCDTWHSAWSTQALSG